MPIASGANVKIALKKQTTHGVLATGNYQTIPAISIRMGIAETFMANDLIGQGRDASRSERDISDPTGQAVVPVDLRAFPHWLAMLMGPPVTTGGPTFVHTFKSGAAAVTEYSIEQQHPDLTAPQYFINRDVLADGMDLEAAPNGTLTATFDLGFGIQTSSGSSGAGTPTSTNVERFSQLQSYIKKDGVSLGKVERCRLPYRNNVERLRYIGDAGAVGDTVLGGTESRGTITARFSDMVLYNVAADKSVFTLEIGWVISASKKISIMLEQCEISAVGSPNVSGSGGIQQSFELLGSKAPVAGNMMTIAVTNDVTAY
jgi:hypothetical protein